MVCVVGRMRDLILQLSKSSIYSTKPVRLRRLGNHLHEQNISLDPLQDGFLDEILAPWLPTTSTNNYRIALRKYQHYQRQTCTGLVQKSSSQPASDIY
ncbi:site-specific integrase, partial [Escherichia coli]|uniref:site-specific integrase n=1 Tax=Escherichia coli TaxID=562 RepID=UPI002575D55A